MGISDFPSSDCVLGALSIGRSSIVLLFVRLNILTQAPTKQNKRRNERITKRKILSKALFEIKKIFIIQK